MTTTKARPPNASESFLSAREHFEVLVQMMMGDEAPQSHGELEEAVVAQGNELQRHLLQARYDLLFERERAEFARVPPAEGVEVRARVRHLELQVGRVAIWRHGVTACGESAAKFPMDERLNLPPDLYSHPLRERVLDEARRGAWDQAVEHVAKRTQGCVPKRQAEELATHAVQDFEAFYAERHLPANDSLGKDALLVASCDNKGIRMRPEALRDATRKLAEAEQAEAVRGDPMATKKLRQHDKRMALVTAVWEQEPHRRKAQEIIDNLRLASDEKATKRKKSRKARAPRPQGKRLMASVEKSQPDGIAEMFEELDRRDPGRTRPVVMLIDGEENQKRAIIEEECRRGRSMVLVLDIIHVLSCATTCERHDSHARRELHPSAGPSSRKRAAADLAVPTNQGLLSEPSSSSVGHGVVRAAGSPEKENGRDLFDRARSSSLILVRFRSSRFERRRRLLPRRGAAPRA